MRATSFLVPVIAALAITTVLPAPAPGASPPPGDKPAHKGFLLPNNVLQVDWDDLLPPDSGQHAESVPPPPQHNYLGNYLGEAAPAAKQTGSFAVNPDLHGLTLRIPGFIVPLDFDSAGRVMRFFLVPYYGACIHVPPPPPNQIVYVTTVTPFLVKDGTDAYWITGKMRIERKRTALAFASYAMTATKIEMYP
ncbi:MAG TPA: DUF3299 domain-containing protein [Steroidobacteraceae bacterium]|nr:DUF3299 domain-containing protein [Steroidobacteraceae bacterium]HUA26614.1 DUF3299 domain-containing protein [Steroidobacteraceae bacterium]